MAEAAVQQRGVRKVREGAVVSRSGDKSIVVEIERRKRHPLYGKTVRHHRRFHAHDEKNEAAVGDVVRIEEARPISRMKRWRLIAVIEKSRVDNGSVNV